MSDGVARLLGRARDSLEDARLLAERRRPNEAVLTRLALHQALQAISLSDGLDADDGLRLDTLFRRVAADHPQAALIGRLREDGAQTIAAVSELVEALSAPPRPAPRREPAPAGMSQRRAAAGGGTDGTGGDGPDGSGSTAFAASPRGRGRAGMVDDVPSTAFWTLMDRWQVPDREALALINHPGGLTRKNTRPRFRLDGEETARYAALRRLDTALETLGIDPRAWLSTALTADPFRGDTPLAVLRRDGAAGARRLLHGLNRQGLAAGLTGPG